MENYDEIFDNGTYGSAQPRLSTEEWIEMKKQERAELYAAIDDMAEKALCDKEALSTYLTLQANLGRTSVNNTLLVMAQKPDATFTYTVSDIEIYENTADFKLPATDGKALMLATCYPFRYSGNAPGKYVITAVII